MLVPFSPELKLGLIPALLKGITELRELAAEHDHEVFINPTPDPRGMQVAIAPKAPSLDPAGWEHAICHVDFAVASQMFIVVDDAQNTHRVSSPRAVFGLLW